MNRKTQEVRGSELYETVILGIADIRNPGRMDEYKRELAKYKRRLRGREEVILAWDDGFYRRSGRGFERTLMGQTIRVMRPVLPQPTGYGYSPYDRSSGFVSHASEYGLLTNSFYNRDINNRRVDKYAEAMIRGEWQDLLSDPIAITSEGQVVNGQHRLAAAEGVTKRSHYAIVNGEKRQGWGSDPLFLVVWGVDPQESRWADGSNRTRRDQATILGKLSEVKDAS